MTVFATTPPQMLAQVISPWDYAESAAHYAARIEVARAVFDSFGACGPKEQACALQAVGAHYAALTGFQTAMQPATDHATAKRCRADAVTGGRMMRDPMKVLKQRRQGKPPTIAATVPGDPVQSEVPAEPAPAVDERDTPERKKRIVASAPVQAFWTTRHPPDVDILAAWDEVIRAGTTVSDAENAASSYTP